LVSFRSAERIHGNQLAEGLGVLKIFRPEASRATADSRLDDERY
jgi:hypothetical protein